MNDPISPSAPVVSPDVDAKIAHGWLHTARFLTTAPQLQFLPALTVPEIAENGLVVPVTVDVESPMTEADYVRAIHIVAEGNPLPNVVSFFFSPRSGRAAVTTRIRLGDSQRVRAIAQMSDGSFWQGDAATLVTLAACTEV